ncbi:MAG: hypothetical protein GF331_17185, partial [Chitinivibrionales bacterium]|nr:hypothetical protein [Chitinivibrionales bacterium]
QHDVEIDHCLFADKTNNRQYDMLRAGNHGCRPTVVIMVADRPHAPPDRHHIHHNHFRDIRPGVVTDGYEAVVLTTGTARPPRGSAQVLMEYNLFERCNGESDIVSIECNDNIIRHNAFIDCRGALSFARGHGNIACGNYFDGMRNGGGCGVRVFEAFQQITNNHFRRLRWGVSLLCDAMTFDGRRSPRIHRGTALILSNTFERCDWGITVAAPRTAGRHDIAPSLQAAWTIANNTFDNTVVRDIDCADSHQSFILNWIGNVSYDHDPVSGPADPDIASVTVGTAAPSYLLRGGDPENDRVVASCDMLYGGRSDSEHPGAAPAFAAVSLPIVMPLSEEDVGPFGYLVSSPPVIERQPRDVTVQDGGAAAFSVTATGWPLFFQWYRDGERLEDETEPTLTIERVSGYDDGAQYHVLIDNENGTVSSDTVVLTVVPFTNVYIVGTDDTPAGGTDTLPLGTGANDGSDAGRDTCGGCGGHGSVLPAGYDEWRHPAQPLPVEPRLPELPRPRLESSGTQHREADGER